MEPHFGGVPIRPECGGFSGHENNPVAIETCERDARQLGLEMKIILCPGVHMKTKGVQSKKDATFIRTCRLL